MSYSNTYSTSFGESYNFSIPKLFKTQSSTTDHDAVYADSQLSLYDNNYNQLIQKKQSLQLLKYTSDSAITQYFRHSTSSSIAFPIPYNFETKKQFLEAVHVWHEYIRKTLTGITLPYPILSKVYIPSRPFRMDLLAQQYNRFDQTANPLLPKNMEYLHRMLITDDRLPPDEEFPHQLPKKIPVLVKHQINTEPQWQSSCIPHEPNLLIYSNFDDYLSAYESWHKITCLQLSTPPIPPDQFENLISLKKNPEMEYEKESSIKPIPQEFPIDYSWTQNLAEPTIHLDVNRFRVFSMKEDHHDYQHYLVYGVDRDKFLKNIKNSGDSKKTFREQKLIYPFTFIWYMDKKKATEDLSTFLHSLNSSMSFRETTQFLHWDYKIDKYESIILETEGKLSLKYMLAANIKPFEIMKLIEIAKNSDQHAIRVAHMLSTLVSSELYQAFTDFLFIPGDFFRNLYQFIKVAVLLSDNNIEIYKPPAKMTEFDFLVFKLHYCTILTTIPICNFTFPFFRYLIKASHDCHDSISEWLKDGDLVDKLWDSLKQETPTALTLEMYIFAALQPDTICLRLFRNDFFERVAEISNYKCGRGFLLRMIYHDCGRVVLMFIRKASPIIPTNVFQNMTKESERMIMTIFAQYAAFLGSIGAFAPQQELIKLLIDIIEHYNENCHSIVFILLKIITLKRLLLDKNRQNQENLIVPLVKQICQSAVSQESRISLLDAALYVSACLKIPGAAEEAAKYPEIISFVLEQMNSSQNDVNRRAWKFWRRLTSSPSITKSLLANENFGKTLSTLSYSENPTIFMNYCRFVTHISESVNSGTLDLLLARVSSAIGRFACTLKLANNIFRGNLLVLREIEKMLKAVAKNDKTKFKEDLGNHLKSLGIDLTKH
ncbi:hypothetical protein TVAG_190430 [Trichomonas vaginalis G3]|uniref:Uncharacterized protein n=1 Tax=Trichomonas vaginalis (strain ATCC PRA-98 / G3) TaxID=412133 RepID=A2DKH1_TRIV3|nr:SCA1 complex scaffold protein SCAA family [Trichomonas vaginalis G3]EAY19148.1 hypothetical protein TVAG_190430 [Trichomonas vaginalis G3]KAI5490446.1 SCA1 complex scaffold protein SCAA family [Trichomonas vaginalis G3]|eukprot:XP_001580134.1 hypothetical protein [Trichomonas vaginalis G3]